MKKTIIITLCIIAISVGAAMWTEPLIEPKPKNRTMTLHWNIPNATIRNGSLIYDTMTGVWAKQEGPAVRIYTLSRPKNYTEQRIGNATIVQRLVNISQTNITKWPIWNRTTNRIKYLLADKGIYTAIWAGGTIETNTTKETYNGTLEELERFHRDAFSYLPKPQIEISPKARTKPYQIIPASFLIAGGIIGIAIIKKENNG